MPHVFNSPAVVLLFGSYFVPVRSDHESDSMEFFAFSAEVFTRFESVQSFSTHAHKFCRLGKIMGRFSLNLFADKNDFLSKHDGTRKTTRTDCLKLGLVVANAIPTQVHRV